MHSFSAVARHGVVTDAAAELNISQSALSRRLHQLERNLGVELLFRRHDGVQVTQAGREVLLVGRQLLDQYDQLRNDLQGLERLERGSIRVGGGATATSFMLPACIARFRASHPGLTFYVKEAGSRQIASDVADGNLDLGIVTTPVNEKGLKLEHLTTDAIVLVAPTDHCFATGPVKRRDLNGTPIIGFESGTAIRTLIDSALATANLNLDVVAELRSIPTMLNMVHQTGIPAFVSRSSLTEAPDTLTEIHVTKLKITRELALATRHQAPMAPATSAFIKLLREAQAARHTSILDPR